MHLGIGRAAAQWQMYYTMHAGMSKAVLLSWQMLWKTLAASANIRIMRLWKLLSVRAGNTEQEGLRGCCITSQLCRMTAPYDVTASNIKSFKRLFGKGGVM